MYSIPAHLAYNNQTPFSDSKRKYLYNIASPSLIEFKSLHMLSLFVSWAIASARGLESQNYSEKSPLLKEAVNLIYNYTNMTVLDTAEFEDQIHLLVDDMTHESGDAFDLLMGKLASNGHIAMVSANSVDNIWPLEPLVLLRHKPILESENNNFKRQSELVLEKRKKKPLRYIPRYLLTYPDANCECHDFNGRYVFRPARCIKIGVSGVHSGYLYNPLAYSMHIAVYRRDKCRPVNRILYRWHKPRSCVCYRVLSGDSMWWSWPGYESPRRPLC